MSFDGGKDLSRTTNPDIRVFIETPTSAFDPEYFVINLCEGGDVAIHASMDPINRFSWQQTYCHQS